MRKGSVIRALGEDTRIVRVASRTHGRAQMAAISRRKRTVAHDIADVPLLFAVMVRRRTSFQEDPSIVFLTLGAVHRATQQGRGGAMLRGGSFDQSGGCQELHGEWRMRRVAELSSAGLQEV